MRFRTTARFLMFTALALAPATAHARRRRPPPPTEPTPPANPPDTTTTTTGGTGSDSGSMTFTTDEGANPNATTTTTTDTTTTTTTDTGNSGTGGLFGGGNMGLGDIPTAKIHPMVEKIWAVQQIYALRNRRLEFQPSVLFSLNDPYVAHTGFGLAMNYWITNVLAAGINFNWFGGLNGRSDVDLRVARSSQLAVPLNEYQLSAAVNMTYVPVYGKFQMFNRFIFHWDLYVLAGIGFTRTRPYAVIDPEVRFFQEFNNLISFNLGVGVRVFVNRYFGIFGEFRNYIYPERLENLNTCSSLPDPQCGGKTRRDPETWLGDSALTVNVAVQVGVVFFIPEVHYSLQK